MEEAKITIEAFEMKVEIVLDEDAETVTWVNAIIGLLISVGHSVNNIKDGFEETLGM